MEKVLTEKQLFNRLNKYYKEHYGELDTDEWYVNPADNIWKFVRDGKTIILVCDMQTGEVKEG
jgi:hypothetical protein